MSTIKNQGNSAVALSTMIIEPNSGTYEATFHIYNPSRYYYPSVGLGLAGKLVKKSSKRFFISRTDWFLHTRKKRFEAFLSVWDA